MKIRQFARPLGLFAVFSAGILAIVASNPSTRPPTPPVTPTNLILNIPSDAFGAGVFVEVPPTTPASGSTPAIYRVLPLLTSVPMVQASFTIPANTVPTVSVTDNGTGQTVALPQNTSGGPGPATGFFVLQGVSPWLLLIHFPESFKNSKSISTAISDLSGQQSSDPVVFTMVSRATTVQVTIKSGNNDGIVTSNPPGISCSGALGMCSFDFIGFSNVILTQSVLHNQTEFIGWTGNCAGANSNCTVPLNFTPVAVTANFRVHVDSAPPLTMSCSAPPVPGKVWVETPNCGTIPTSQGAVLQCDSNGYFCCGASGGNSSLRCSGHNQTTVTCAHDDLGVSGNNEQLIQPGGCYVPAGSP